MSKRQNDDSDADVESGSNDSVQWGKKAFGSCVVHSNGYFTVTDNPDFPDVKVKALEKWCKADCLGRTAKSKTVVPTHFGEDRSAPHRSMLVLKAWMMWKARSNN